MKKRDHIVEVPNEEYVWYAMASHGIEETTKALQGKFPGVCSDLVSQYVDESYNQDDDIFFFSPDEIDSDFRVFLDSATVSCGDCLTPEGVKSR